MPTESSQTLHLAPFACEWAQTNESVAMWEPEGVLPQSLTGTKRIPVELHFCYCTVISLL